MKKRLLAVAEVVLLATVILAGAIALPVLCRPFFYLHIEPMELTKRTGFTPEQIKEAYAAMMDYCIGLTDVFSVGVLPFSESGAAHFADVKKLFLLDLRVLALTAVLLAGVVCFRRKKRAAILGHTPGFWAAIGLGAVFLTVGGLAALDFQKAFTVFHRIFFPGKDNWIFNYHTDPVIRMLPEEFFRNCGILILTVIVISCMLLILHDISVRRKTSRLR